MADRMSEDDGSRHHPAAIETAKSLEHAGYVQTPHKELEDGEDVIAVDGRTGHVAPVRHHKYGELNDKLTVVDHHVLEAFPGSAHSQKMPLRHAYAKVAEGDPESKPFSHLALFRMSAPEHARHGQHLYAAREAAHRAG